MIIAATTESREAPLTFDTLVDSAYERVIVDRYLLDIDDARPVFLTFQKWVEKAKSYYTADSEASEYAKIVQDHATAYKHLAFFESDPANQSKMHKRRIDLLEDLRKLLNKTYYLHIVREILYELGIAYSNLLDIKLDTMNRDVPNPHGLKKINDLCTKCRTNLMEFISTYFQPRTETLSTNLDADELIPIAFAYFQIGRVWYKYITPDRSMQITHATNCLENYQKFVDLCSAHEEVGEKMKAEMGVSKEMIQLLPFKIQRLSEGAGAASPAKTP